MNIREIVLNSSIIDNFAILIKFGERRNLEKLQKGSLYMKNLKYYNKIEEEQNKIGMGDKIDGKSIMFNMEWMLIDDKNKKVIASSKKNSDTIFDFHMDLNPVFCLFTLDKRNIDEILKKDKENIIQCKLKFNANQIKNIRKNFGDSALVIKSTNDFLDRIENRLNEEDIKIARRKISYYDKNVNELNRIEQVFGNPDNAPFWKERDSFEYQQEYRIFCLNKQVEDHYEINIGDISDITELLSMDQIFKGECELEVIHK